MIPLDDGNGEIGYHVAKAYTGNGYATEAIKAFLPVAAKLVGTDTVQGICLSENVASKHVLHKCGFETVFEGVGTIRARRKTFISPLGNYFDLFEGASYRVGKIIFEDFSCKDMGNSYENIDCG